VACRQLWSGGLTRQYGELRETDGFLSVSDAAYVWAWCLITNAEMSDWLQTNLIMLASFFVTLDQQLLDSGNTCPQAHASADPILLHRACSRKTR